MDLTRRLSRQAAIAALTVALSAALAGCQSGGSAPAPAASPGVESSVDAYLQEVIDLQAAVARSGDEAADAVLDLGAGRGSLGAVADSLARGRAAQEAMKDRLARLRVKGRTVDLNEALVARLDDRIARTSSAEALARSATGADAFFTEVRTMLDADPEHAHLCAALDGIEGASSAVVAEARAALGC